MIIFRTKSSLHQIAKERGGWRVFSCTYVGVRWLGCFSVHTYERIMVRVCVKKKGTQKSHDALDLFLFQSYMHENASLLQVLEFGVGKEFEKKAFARYKLPTPVPPHVIYFLVSQETLCTTSY